MVNGSDRFTTPPDSDSDSYSDSDIDIDDRDFVNHRFDSPTAEHNRTSEHDRRVKLIIRNAHDNEGPGMTFEIKYRHSLKDALECFKTACCPDCRATDEIRFKTKGTLVSEDDTPKKLKLLHNTTTEIGAWSNVPGMQCKACQRGGYPKTRGVVTPVPPSQHTKRAQSNKAETIVLLVKDQTNFETSIKMLNTNPMRFLMKTYADRSMRDQDHVRFFYDGEQLCRRETPKQLGLINNDIIQVFIEQIGG